MQFLGQIDLFEESINSLNYQYNIAIYRHTHASMDGRLQLLIKARTNPCIDFLQRHIVGIEVGKTQVYLLQDPFWQFAMNEMEGMEVTVDNMHKVVRKCAKKFAQEKLS